MGKLDPVRREVKAAAVAALTAIGQDLEGKAARDAPKAEGVLRGSAHSEIVDDGDTVWVEVSFSTPYAARQHEELGYAHTDGEAKYLEKHLLAEVPRYQGVLALAIGKAV